MRVDIALESRRDLEKVAGEFFREAKPLRSRRTLGVDIGRVQDHTAVALVECHEVLTDFDNHGAAYRKEERMTVRYLERMPLGMSWPDIVKRLRDIQFSMAPDDRPKTIVVDKTGVGDAVLSMIREARIAGQVIGINITGGLDMSLTNHSYNVPKRDLITNLQVLLQGKQLQVARRLPDAALLVKEMQSMEVRVGSTGREQMGCWREKEHDDLVLATSLACWWLSQGNG